MHREDRLQLPFCHHKNHGRLKLCAWQFWTKVGGNPTWIQTKRILIAFGLRVKWHTPRIFVSWLSPWGKGLQINQYALVYHVSRDKRLVMRISFLSFHVARWCITLIIFTRGASKRIETIHHQYNIKHHQKDAKNHKCWKRCMETR